MKILITGGSGFIGNRLRKRLPEHTLLCPTRTDLRLCDATHVKTWMSQHQPECIIHLAADPNPKPDPEWPENIINNNVLITQLLCHYAPPDCRFIFASSVVVYGDTPYPFDEQQRCSPKTVYGATKLASEAIVNAYTQQQKIRGVSLRLCSTVGAGLTHGMLHDFIRKVQLDTKELEVFGDCPGSHKPAIYIKDVIKTIQFMIDNPYYTRPINVTSQGVVSVEWVAKTVMKMYDVHKPIKWLGSGSVWKGDDHLLQVSPSQLCNLGLNLKSVDSNSAIILAIMEIQRSHNIHKRGLS